MLIWRSFIWNKPILEILSGSWVIPKNVWKNGKKRLHKKRYTFEINEDFFIQIKARNFYNRSPHWTKISNLYLLNWLRINPSKSDAVGPGRAGSSCISIIWSKDFFLFYKQYRKNRWFLRYCISLISHKTVERSSRLRACSASLRVTCSQKKFHNLLIYIQRACVPNEFFALSLVFTCVS